MSSVNIRQNINLLQEIKDYLFGKKDERNHELNCYTVLGFKDKDDFVEKSNPNHRNTISRSRKRLKGIIKKNLKRINSQYPSNDDYTNEGIKKEGLSFIIDLKNGAQSYLANLQKEEAFKKNNDINKITEDKGSNLYRFRCTLNYIEKIEEHLGISLEQTLEKTIDKFILIRKIDKLEREFEEEIKKFNKKYPFLPVFEDINDGIQTGGLAFVTKLKQEALIKTKGEQGQSGLVLKHYYTHNYIKSMEKSLGFSVDDFSSLSQIRKDSIKVLMNPNLRLAYDEGVAKKELSPLASYEECVKYQQRVNERDSSVGESKAVVENDHKQIKETLHNDEKAEKASIVKRIDINYLPLINISMQKPNEILPQSFKKVQVVQNLKGNAINNLHVVQKPKWVSFSNTMTLLLSIYGKPISNIFGMKNFQTSVVTRFSWPNLSINMGKALKDSQIGIEASQKAQQNDHREITLLSNIFSSVKSWCHYNIIEPVVNFTDIIKSGNNKSEIECGTVGQYTKINSDVIDKKQAVDSQLCNVTIQKLSIITKCLG